MTHCRGNEQRGYKPQHAGGVHHGEEVVETTADGRHWLCGSDVAQALNTKDPQKYRHSGEGLMTSTENGMVTLPSRSLG